MKFIFTLIASIAFTAGGAVTNFVPLALEGQTFSHDPSTIMKDGANYFSFGTGPGIRTKSSPDLIHWTNRPAVFNRPPAWSKNVAPGFDGFIWAPEVVRVNGRFFLYYSVSAFGKQTSAIGLVTNATLDFTATNFLWHDAGIVIRSTNGDAFNTIDPGAFLDADGKFVAAESSVALVARPMAEVCLPNALTE